MSWHGELVNWEVGNLVNGEVAESGSVEFTNLPIYQLTNWLSRALDVPRDLFAGCEPDTRFRLHIADELIEVMHRRAMADHVRVQCEDEHRSLLVGAVEFFAIQLEQLRG